MDFEMTPDQPCDKPDCPSCNRPIEPYYAHCPHCGHDLRVECGVCGRRYSRHERECPYCQGDPVKAGRPEPTLTELRACTPRSRRANRPDGGWQHGHLRFRRMRWGY